MNNTSTEPFLRWAGGKRWLARSFREEVFSNNFNHYHEPFVGCGAVFFHLFSGREVTLSDTNLELTNTYRTLRDNSEDIIRELLNYHNSEEFYYRMRATVFTDPIQLAARFIYLNQTSFNGIYRVNIRGEYNVPYGFRSKRFPNEEILHNASKALINARIFDGDFTTCIDRIEAGDLVYLDPPYTVTHNNNGFIKYNNHLFSLDDFYRLSDFIDQVKRRNAFYILSNAAHPQVKDIFDKNDVIYNIKRASLIGGKNAFRGQIDEYVFTNIETLIFNEACEYERI